MQNTDIISTILQQIKKLEGNQLQLINEDRAHQETIIQELEALVELFNQTTEFPETPNAHHLKNILQTQLPTLKEVLEKITTDLSLRDAVIDEFNNSTYLNDVWKIANTEHLYTNIMVLIYRTTLLKAFPYLKQNNAQISSTLEEMSALLALKGTNTKVFDATKHWIISWQEEGFSEKLYKQLIEKYPALNITNIQEPVGNFMQIFSEFNYTREEIIHMIEQTGIIKVVKPLEYFLNVGNGMSPETQKQEINNIIPEKVVDQKQRANIALDYLEQGNHIGVSQKQYERDFKNRKDHDATIRFFLEKILANQQLEPCVVVVTDHASAKFDKNAKKVILDGTHRAIVSALVSADLKVLEFSID